MPTADPTDAADAAEEFPVSETGVIPVASPSEQKNESTPMNSDVAMPAGAEQTTTSLNDAFNMFFAACGMTPEDAGKALANMSSYYRDLQELNTTQNAPTRRGEVCLETPKAAPRGGATLDVAGGKAVAVVAPRLGCGCKIAKVGRAAREKSKSLTVETYKQLIPGSLLLVFHKSYKKWRLARYIGSTPYAERPRYNLLMKNDLEKFKTGGEGEEELFDVDVFVSYAGSPRRQLNKTPPAASTKMKPKTKTVLCAEPWNHMRLICMAQPLEIINSNAAASDHEDSSDGDEEESAESS